MKPGSFPPSRRGFLAGALAGAALAPLDARTGIYNPLLAARTSTWLPLATSPDPVFVGISRAGYSRVALDSEFTAPALASATRAALRQHRLQPTLASFDAPYDAIPEQASAWKDAGLRAVEVPATPGADPLRLTHLGHHLQRLGMQLLLRTTAAALAGDAAIWKSLVRETEAPVVSLSIDVAWAADPLALLDASSARLACVSLQSRRDGVPAEEVGDGRPDMPRLAAFLRRICYDGYLLVDLPPLPARTQTVSMALAHSRWYVHQIFGMRPGATPVDMGPHVRTRRK